MRKLKQNNIRKERCPVCNRYLDQIGGDWYCEACMCFYSDDLVADYEDAYDFVAIPDLDS